MTQEDDDFQIEDVLGALNNKKRRKNSKDKGNRGEGNLCKILIKRFNKPFSRVPTSGARIHQVALSEEAKQLLTGDIVTPVDFAFCIESKHGYPEIDFCKALEGGQKPLDEFMDQAEKDANRIGRRPLLCYKKNRMPWIAFVKNMHSPIGVLSHEAYPYTLHYRDWVGVALSELLKEPDTYWFQEKI